MSDQALKAMIKAIDEIKKMKGVSNLELERGCGETAINFDLTEVEVSMGGAMSTTKYQLVIKKRE